MSQVFFELSATDQKDALLFAAQTLGRVPAMLEKDLWVLWALEQLFAFEGQNTNVTGLRDGKIPQIAFKGGTSLSKAFGAIQRFSEDVDIAIDQTAFETGINPFADTVSNSQIERHQEAETKIINHLLNDEITPRLQKAAQRVSSHGSINISITPNKDGELEIFVKYPALFQDTALLETVKLEIGGRNPIEPIIQKTLQADLCSVIPELICPSPTVSVLTAERTFWEKATLIHAECHRKAFDKDSLDRKSRHWSDLVALMQHGIAASAFTQPELLRIVVQHKTRFYKSNRANYGACLTGQMRLTPEEKMLELLEQDYKKMQPMFFATPLEFAVLLEEIQQLETQINQIYKSNLR